MSDAQERLAEIKQHINILSVQTMFDDRVWLVTELERALEVIQEFRAEVAQEHYMAELDGRTTKTLREWTEAHYPKLAALDPKEQAGE